MANSTQYRKAIHDLLQDHTTFGRGDPNVDTELILDTIRDHYGTLNFSDNHLAIDNKHDEVFISRYD
jgi:XisI protein